MIRSFFKLGIASAIPILIGIATTPIMLNRMGSTDFGIYLLLISLVAYLSMLDLGIGRLVTKRVAENGGVIDLGHLKTSIVLSLSLCFFIIISFTTIGFAFSADFDAFLKQPNSSTIVLILALIVATNIIGSPIMAVMEGSKLFSKIALYRCLINSSQVVAPLVPMYVMNTDGLHAVLYAVLTVKIICLLFLVYDYIDILNATLSKNNRFVFQHFWVDGSLITLNNLLSSIMYTADKLVVSIACGINNIAIYALPSDIFGKMLLLPNTISQVLFPEFAGSNNIGELRKKLIKFQIVVAVLSLLFISIIFSQLRFLLDSWLGSAFATESILNFELMLIAFFIVCTTYLPAVALQAIGFFSTLSRIYVFEAILFVGLVFFLGRVFGLEGAMFAFLMRIVADSVLINYFFYKRIV